MFLQIYQTAPDKLLYKDGFLLQFLFDICWLVKIHRECKERKRIWMENMKKNPYSGNFRQLFIFCQLVLDFKQVIYNLREWIKQSRWVRMNWVLQVLVRFSKVAGWLVKIHRECKERKRIWMENMKKNPYSGNFRQLFIFCQLVLDFKQVIYNLREWIKQSRWVRVNWVLQVLMRFSKVTRFPFILNLC